MMGLSLGLSLSGRTAGGGAPPGPPDPPTGFIYLTDTDGSRLTDPDGTYLMEAI